MASYLVTGASRGIGLELVKQLLELPVSQVGKVFAVTRSELCAPSKAITTKTPDRAIHVIASVDDTESVQRAAKDVEAKLGGQGLDVLVNNAGAAAYNPGGMKTVASDLMAHQSNINVIGPQRMVAAFLPLLEAGNQKKVINVSSTLGSISLAAHFGSVPSQAYKITKAALNMLNAQYAVDHSDAGFTFLCVSPGWLKTDLGGQDADLSVEVGVTELKRIILESNQTQNGKFLNIHVPGQERAQGRYDGREIPW